MSDDITKSRGPRLNWYELVGGTLLNLIPGCGGAVAHLWTQYYATKQFARLEEVVGEVRLQLAKRVPPLSVENLGENEWALFEAVIRRAQEATTARKRALFATLIATSWSDPGSPPFDEQMVFVRALDVFTELHLWTLAVLCLADETDAISYSHLRDKITDSALPAVERNSIMVPLLGMLAAQFGFIIRSNTLNNPAAGRAEVLSRGLSPEGFAYQCNHAITPLGRRFMSSIDYGRSKGA